MKPGTEFDPAVVGADKAIEDGSVDHVIQLVTGDVARGICHRFARVVEARKHADHSVEAGREFAATHVECVHYVENVALVASGKASGHTESGQAVPAAAHSHK